MAVITLRQIVRPIEQWPGALTQHRKHARFGSTYTQSKELLNAEVNHIRKGGIYEYVLMLNIEQWDLKLNGELRANARPVGHPGVIVAFESKFGPLQYATDVFYSWEDNFRAIALSLEALRKVDRYGVSKRGEQYTGWAQIGSGIPMGMGSSKMDEETALKILRDGSDIPVTVNSTPEQINTAFKAAARKHHPDAGGSEDRFKLIEQARDALVGKL
jgi:hypothetical protein